MTKTKRKNVVKDKKIKERVLYNCFDNNLAKSSDLWETYEYDGIKTYETDFDILNLFKVLNLLPVVKNKVMIPHPITGEPMSQISFMKPGNIKTNVILGKQKFSKIWEIKENNFLIRIVKIK